MNRSIRHLLSATVIGAVAIGIASVVFARGGFGPGWGGHHGMMGQGMGYGPGYGTMMGPAVVGYSDEKISELKTTIGITAEQESAWNEYVAALKDKANLMQAHRELRFNNSWAFFDQHQSFHQQGTAQMEKVFSATKNLRNILTPEQQSKVAGLIGANYCL